MNEWSAYIIKVVLHHYSSPTRYEGDDLPLYKRVTEDLKFQGILEWNGAGYFDVTEKGKALVYAWCETPVPVMKWVDPRFDRDAALKAKQMGVGE